jgi:hypothetical protein
MSERDGRIVWHRKWAWTGGAGIFRIRIDEQVMGAVGNGGTLGIDVGAGDHYIQVSQGPLMKSSRLLVRIESGQEVRISSSLPFAAMGRIKLQVDKTISRKVIETEHYETPAGNDEVRTIDNLQGTSEQVRTFGLAREWSKSYSVGSSQSTTFSESAEFSSKLVDIKTQAELRVEQNYNMTSQRRQTFEDTLTVKAAPHTYSEIRIAWKEIRQRGYVDEFDGPVHISRTPFELVVGLTYDPQQIDRHSP